MAKPALCDCGKRRVLYPGVLKDGGAGMSGPFCRECWLVAGEGLGLNPAEVNRQLGNLWPQGGVR